MTRIPELDRDTLESAIYLPMLLTILERDRLIFEQINVKIKEPYLNLIENTIKAVQADHKVIRDKMRKENMKVWEVARDKAFTSYAFLYKGYEEHHNYFNPAIRNRVAALMERYINTKA